MKLDIRYIDSKIRELKKDLIEAKEVLEYMFEDSDVDSLKDMMWWIDKLEKRIKVLEKIREMRKRDS